MAKAKNDEASS